MDRYEPYDHELYEVEDPRYPVDNHKRFLLSDNWKMMQRLDIFFDYAHEKGLSEVPVAELVKLKGLEDFAVLWKSDYLGFNIEVLDVQEMKFYRDFLWFENWRIENEEGNEMMGFTYPPRFNTKTLTIGWS